jgi:5-methylcytosine-specific restriction endonuclease McrA
MRRIWQNPLTVRALRANRRAKENGAQGKFNRRTIENLYVKQEGKCACCGVVLYGVFEVDHIIPLSRGGSNCPSNLQLLTPFCNQSKGSKTMEEYLKWKQ